MSATKTVMIDFNFNGKYVNKVLKQTYRTNKIH